MQNTWESFTSLDSALQGTRGNTQSTIILARDNLFLDEKVEWVATGSVLDLGDWSDASVVVTDQRVFVCYTNLILEQTYGNMTSRVPVPEIVQLQGGGDKAHFLMSGITDSTISLKHEHLKKLKDLLSSTDVLSAPGAAAPAAEDPKAALLIAKELLDAGLISEAEYDAKKQEILSRL